MKEVKKDSYIGSLNFKNKNINKIKIKNEKKIIK